MTRRTVVGMIRRITGRRAALGVVVVLAAVLASARPAPLEGLVAMASGGTAAATLAPPTITQEPADATDSGRAKFKLDHPRKDVTFECSLDGSPFTPCEKNVQYRGLAPADHCFAAKAVDPKKNRSGAAQRCWTNLDPATFGISGSASQPFFPGRAVVVDLRFANPHNQPIQVLAVDITIARQTSSAGCPGDENLVVRRPFTGPVTVPARSTMTLSELRVPAGQWPELEMPNLPVNQDACKGTDFTITYTGRATK